MVGRRSFSGCGGEKLTPALALAGTRWTIASIDGQPVHTARMTDIRFSETQIAGNAGCNNFGGRYDQDRNMLVTRALISTKMASRCRYGNGKRLLSRDRRADDDQRARR